VDLLGTTGCPGRGYDSLHRNGWETNTSKEGEILKLKENAGIRTGVHVFMLEMMQMCLIVRRFSFLGQPSRGNRDSC